MRKANVQSQHGRNGFLAFAEPIIYGFILNFVTYAATTAKPSPTSAPITAPTALEDAAAVGGTGIPASPNINIPATEHFTFPLEENLCAASATRTLLEGT